MKSSLVKSCLAAFSFALVGMVHSAHATDATWANSTELNGTLTAVGTGGLYTYSGTLAQGDTIQASSSAAGLSSNTLYYVIAVNSGTYTLSASPGATAITGAASGTVTVNGVYSWGATAASGVENGASWTGGVPSGVDAVATIANMSNNSGNSVNIAIQQDTTIGTINVSQGNKQWALFSSNLGTSSTLAALNFATTATTPAGPSINTSTSNQLLRFGFNDSSFHGGTLKITGSQGLTLILGSSGARIGGVDWSGFTNGSGGVGTLTLQKGQVQTTTGNVLGSGAGALNVVIGNASSVSDTTAPELNMGNSQNISVNNLDGTASGRISGASRTLTIGAGNGTNTDFQGIIGQTAGGANNATSLTKNGSGTQTISGNIVGAGAVVTVNGAAGTLVLNGSNSYSGGTAIQAGTLTVGNKYAMGSGTISFNSSTAGSVSVLQSNTDLSGVNKLQNALVIANTSGTATLGGSNNLEISGISILASGSSRTLTVTNSATATLSGTTFLTDTDTASRTATINGSGNLVISGNIANNAAGTNANAAALIYNGSGVLTLSGSNTYSGGTAIQAGTLTVGNKYALGSGTISFNSTTAGSASVLQSNTDLSGANKLQNTLIIANTQGTATLGGSSNLEISGTSILASGANRTLTVTNSATATLSGPTFLTDTDTASRTATINGSGNLVISGNIANNAAGTNTNATALAYGGSGLLTLSGNNTYSGATSISSGTVRLGSSTALGSGTLSSLSGVLDFNGNSISTPVADKAIFNGTLTNTGAAVDLTGMGTLGATAARSLFVDGTGGITFGQSFTGSYTLTKNGSNTMTLSGTTGNSLGLVVNAGKVVLAKTGVNAINGSGATVNGGVLQLGGSGGDQINNSSPVVLISGSLDMNGLSETAGKLTVGDGTNNGSAIGGVNSTYTNSGTSFEMKSGSVDVKLAGSAVLNKTTAGTVTLSQACTYTGATNVNGGTLIVSGSLQGTSLVVNTGASLNLAAGATSKGNNATVNSGASLSLASGGKFTFTIAASGVNNSINNSGSVSLDGTFVLDLTNASTTGGASWALVVGGASYTGNFAVVDQNNNAFTQSGSDWIYTTNGGITYDYSTANGTLQALAVPEPSTWAILLGGLGMLGLFQRTRSRFVK